MFDLPTPIEVLLDPVSLVVLAMYAGLAAWETIAPARDLPRVRGWRRRGLIAFAVYFYLSTYLPLLWDASLAPYRLVDLSGLGTAGATVLGLLVYELGAWAYHRLIHRSDRLFRAVHQMHHSAERVDTTGAFYFSPLDMVGWTALGSLCLVLIAGVPPAAATAIVLITTWLGLFQHANIRTPRWLGYVVQRPEQHTVHHARGIHAHNCSALPIFDLLFGTFSNPRTFEHETGFYHGASARVGDMLMMRDVTVPPRDARDRRPLGARYGTAGLVLAALLVGAAWPSIAVECGDTIGPKEVAVIEGALVSGGKMDEPAQTVGPRYTSKKRANMSAGIFRFASRSDFTQTTAGPSHAFAW